MHILQGIEYLHTLDDAELIAFDVETTGLQPRIGGLRLLQLATPGKPPVVIDMWKLEKEDDIELEEFFSVEREWVAHNAVFDLGWLQEYELYPQGEIFCTLLASRILTNGRPNMKHGLQHVVKRYLKREISKEEQRSDWSQDLTTSQLEYAATDVLVLLELYDKIEERMTLSHLNVAWSLECRALPAMAQLWRTGLPFDRQCLLQLIEDLDTEHAEVGSKFIEDFDAALPKSEKLHRAEDGSIKYQTKAGAKGKKPDPEVFNLNSPVQLLRKFTALLGQPPVDPKSEKKSASKSALQEYVADHAVVADYGQMELRLAAAEAQDPLMTQVFQQGKDLHTITATQIYGVAEDEVTKEQRQVSKSANFGLLYGSGAKGLRNYAAQMGIQMDLAEAAEVREKFHAAYKGIAAWQRENARLANADKNDPSIRIRHSELRRFLPGENNKLTTRCNTPIQGAGAAVLKVTLGKLWSLLHADGEDVVRLAGVVHDEIILLVKEEHADAWAEQLQCVMEECEARWLGDIPPLAEANVGNSWDQAK